jgi:hypothetical protein
MMILFASVSFVVGALMVGTTWVEVHGGFLSKLAPICISAVDESAALRLLRLLVASAGAIWSCSCGTACPSLCSRCQGMHSSQIEVTGRRIASTGNSCDLLCKWLLNGCFGLWSLSPPPRLIPITQGKRDIVHHNLPFY